MEMLKINTRIIDELIQILKENYFNQNACNSYLNFIEVKGILFHDRMLNRNSNAKIFANELSKLQLNHNYKDKYNLYILKENHTKIEEQIERLKKGSYEINYELNARLIQFMPIKLMGKVNVILYGGGIDFGFVLIPKHVYLNIGDFIDNFEAMKDTLVHEMYHARKRNILKYLVSLYGDVDTKNRCFKKVLTPIIEEGIASLIGYGVEFKCYPNSIIRENDFENNDIHFQKLNKIFKIILFSKSSSDIKSETKNYICTKGLLDYVIGYTIAKEIYLKYGIKGLNIWTINYDSLGIFKAYIVICKNEGKESGFTKEIEEWFLNKI